VSRLRILFIDSDIHTQSRFLPALSDSFTVKCVSSAAEAKQQLDSCIPDMVISEVLLSGQENGLELCHYIRSMPLLSHLPILLLTSLATLQDKVAGFDAGADDYVVKPCDARHLIARIRLLARIKKLEQQQKSY
jgi:DNA-binding response OmpR family regulator